jgi:uncharacterized membrane protein
MPETIENYAAQSMIGPMRRQAWKVWMIGLAVVFAWVSLILIAPIAKANGLVAVSSPLYHFFSYICHQIPARSFFIEGEQFGVCSRCFGVYFGLLLGFAVYPLWRSIDEIEPLPRFWLFLSLVPISVDWSLTIFGIWENTFLTRFITGLILGFACSTFIIPALVEITRNLSFKKRISTQSR